MSSMTVYGGRPEKGKTAVEVIARFKADGTVTPIRVIWPDGRRYDLRVTNRQTKFNRLMRTPYTEFDVEVVLPNGVKRPTKIWYDGRQWWVEVKG